MEREEQSCTRSIATGSRKYVEAVKFQMVGLGVERQIRKNGENFELREWLSPYSVVFDPEKSDIEAEYQWYLNA
jgi:hypothetical protein